MAGGGMPINLAPMTAAAAGSTDKEHVCTPCMMPVRTLARRPAANAHRYLEVIRLSSLHAAEPYMRRRRQVACTDEPFIGKDLHVTAYNERCKFIGEPPARCQQYRQYALELLLRPI